MKFIEGRIIFLWYIAADRLTNPLEREDTENSDAIIEHNEAGYPLIPDDALELRLSRKKVILRQYMGSARRMFISIQATCQLLNNN
jgi:hypothetical protein